MTPGCVTSPCLHWRRRSPLRRRPARRSGPRADADGLLRYGDIAFRPCSLSAGGNLSAEAQCATLESPRTTLRPGRRIELAIALVPASGMAEADPVYMIASGPGQSALESYPMVHGAFGDDASQPPCRAGGCARHRQVASAALQDRRGRRTVLRSRGGNPGGDAHVHRTLPRRTGEGHRPAPVHHRRPHPRPRPGPRQTRRRTHQPRRRVLRHPRRAAVRGDVPAAHPGRRARLGGAERTGAGTGARAQPGGRAGPQFARCRNDAACSANLGDPRQQRRWCASACRRAASRRCATATR